MMGISRCDSAGFRILLGLALLIATWLALAPQTLDLPDVPQADKWTHLAAYLVLAFLVDAGWPGRGFVPAKWAFLLGYGLAIELFQSQVPNREFSLLDLAANASGIALYAFVVSRVLRARGWR